MKIYPGDFWADLWNDVKAMFNEIMCGKTIIGKIFIGLPIFILSMIALPVIIFGAALALVTSWAVDELAGDQNVKRVGRIIKSIFYKKNLC